MKLALASSMLAIGLLSFACDKDDDNDGQTIEEIPNQLAGTYKTDCTANGVLELSSSNRSIDFSSVGDFDKQEIYYAGDSCTDAPALTYKVKGTVQDKGTLPENGELNMLNFSVNTAVLTPGTQALVNTMNTLKFCGKTDWAVGAESNIESLDCDGFTIKKGDVISDVYDDKDGTLYFGKTFALLLKQTGERPTEVDLDTPYHKQ
jgi:hypothetical protein